MMPRGPGVLALTLVALLAGCRFGTPGPSDDLRYPGFSFGIGLRPQAGNVRTVGGLLLCVDDSNATITDIRAAATHGSIRVSGWGARPNPFLYDQDMLGANSGTVSSLGFSVGPTEIAEPCKGVDTRKEPPPSSKEIAVQITFAGDDSAWVQGLQVHYTAAGREGNLVVPWKIAVCGRPDPKTTNPVDCPKTSPEPTIN